ncbi:hypothetical protein AURDEDRAFT_161322 [Auricularia subglabra TFB-10046 SS5]|nr:hypothetical protein AURDEDRAFT_161322 [Auricularia subglabra TFB-10046 SS5]
MAQESSMTVMENMGRPPGRPPPGNIDHLYPDPDTDLDVSLLVFNNYPELEGRHWMIGWQVGQLKDGVHTVWRELQIVQERGFQHYTNWGPLTKTLDLASTSPPVALVQICKMSRAQRAQLEQIAETTLHCEPLADGGV